LTFSPNGQELLVNLGGEQLYLFDINTQCSPLSYTPAYFGTENDSTSSRNGFVHHETSGVTDEKKATSATLTKRKLSDTNKSKPPGANGYTIAKGHEESTSTPEKSPQLFGKALELKARANMEYEHKNYWGSINLYNQALILAPDSAILYANRAAAYLKRGW
jgi:WD and tetratricopeptide repeat-containing protein 1